jgi:hypothetical protein
MAGSKFELIINLRSAKAIGLTLQVEKICAIHDQATDLCILSVPGYVERSISVWRNAVNPARRNGRETNDHQTQ